MLRVSFLVGAVVLGFGSQVCASSRSWCPEVAFASRAKSLLDDGTCDYVTTLWGVFFKRDGNLFFSEYWMTSENPKTCYISLPSTTKRQSAGGLKSPQISYTVYTKGKHYEAVPEGERVKHLNS